MIEEDGYGSWRSIVNLNKNIYIIEVKLMNLHSH